MTATKESNAAAKNINGQKVVRTGAGLVSSDFLAAFQPKKAENAGE